MHTALCSFDDRAKAERARDRLLAAGFDSQDVHLQHREDHARRHGADPRAWDGMEREVAVDPRVIQSIGDYFGRLFGTGGGHDQAWSRHVHEGRWVLCVDAPDAAAAAQARDAMLGHQPGQHDVVHRPERPRLRDLGRELAAGPAAGPAGSGGTTPPVRGEHAQAAAAERPGRSSRDGWGRTRHD